MKSIFVVVILTVFSNFFISQNFVPFRSRNGIFRDTRNSEKGALFPRITKTVPNFQVYSKEVFQNRISMATLIETQVAIQKFKRQKGGEGGRLHNQHLISNSPLLRK